MDYRAKYLKYKQKYIQLKSHMIGGDSKEDLQKHCVYALNECKSALLRALEDVDCCVNDMTAIEQKMHIKSVLNQEFIDSLVFKEGKRTTPLSPSEKQVIADKTTKFISQAKESMLNVKKVINGSARSVTINKLKNENIPIEELYMHFTNNYWRHVKGILQPYEVMLNELYEKIVKNNLPYVHIITDERMKTCDARITNDCVLFTIGQKFPRIMMPVSEFVKTMMKYIDLGNLKNIKKDNPNTDVVAEMKIWNAYITGEIFKMNECIRKMEEYNQNSFGYASISIDFRKLMTLATCKACDITKDKKSCCKEPCSYAKTFTGKETCQLKP